MIFDCFTFFDELDLLEVRLHTLAPYVDAFVIAEANRTFQGKEKPYVFHQCRHAARFICGKPVYQFPVDLAYLDGSNIAWFREHAQRRALTNALAEMRIACRGPALCESDRIILSDVDEFPDLKIFQSLDPASGTVIGWSQDLFYYWVNMRCWKWSGPISCTWEVFEDLFDGDMQLLRDSRGKAECVLPGGSHFSFLGGANAIKAKIEAFSHTEYLSAADPANIRRALTDGLDRNVDLFGRRLPGWKFELMPDDSHLPPYMVAHKERFQDWWYKP